MLFNIFGGITFSGSNLLCYCRKYYFVLPNKHPYQNLFGGGNQNPAAIKVYRGTSTVFMKDACKDEEKHLVFALWLGSRMIISYNYSCLWYVCKSPQVPFRVN